jgi:hypothetical protein
MSLLQELDGAELVVADEDRSLLFVWYGGAGVQILDESGNVLDTFSISTAFERKLTTREVRRAIDGYRADLAHEDEA